MSNKKLGVILLSVSAVLVIGFGVFRLTSKNAAAPASGSNVVAQQQSEAQTSATLTVVEVKNHSTATDCWTIISGKVYDITKYVPRHPGGDEILRACGADGTALFTTRTTEGGEKVGSGTAHSSSAESQLNQFLLGTLQ